MSNKEDSRQSPMKIYRENQVIVWQNDTDRVLYKIIKGRVAVYLDYQAEGEILITHLDAPCCFGEMALLNCEARTATVVATTETLVLAVDEEGFVPFLVSNPNNAYDIMKNLATSLKNSTELIRQISTELDNKNKLNEVDIMQLQKRIERYCKDSVLVSQKEQRPRK